MKTVRPAKGKLVTARPATKVQVVGKPQSKPQRKQTHTPTFGVGAFVAVCWF